MSSTAHRLSQFKFFDSQAVTGTNTYFSQPIKSLYLDNIFMTFEISGTPVGVFTLQVSNTFEINPLTGQVSNPGTWDDLPVTFAALGSPNPDFISGDVNQTGAPYLRVKYVNSSSSGTINAYASGKGLL